MGMEVLPVNRFSLIAESPWQLTQQVQVVAMVAFLFLPAAPFYAINGAATSFHSCTTF